MLPLMIAAAAAVVGIVIGFMLRGSSARSECARLEAGLAEKTREVGAVRAALEQAQAANAAHAGFEKLAEERAGTITQLTSDCAKLRAEINKKVEEANQSAATIADLNAKLESERNILPDKMKVLNAAEGTFSDHFRRLAGDVLKGEREALSGANTTQIDALLKPLEKEIKDFRERVEQAQRETLVGNTELKAELGNLKELNTRLTTEADGLSRALRQDTQKQGHWGEKILLQLLESSGLQRDVHYTYQESFSTIDEENGQARRQQTDVIVNLPEGRRLIIDSKVTLNAYYEYVNATAEDERETALKRLLKSFRDHYAGLAERNYQHIPGIQSPDFVVLFAPLEPAFMLAIREEGTLWEDAYRRGVLLAGPTTILFVVRIVENLWRQEKNKKSVDKIVDRGNKLYDKFVGFVTDLEAVGEKIAAAGECYREAFGKLTSGRENLVRQVEMLRELGLKPKKRFKTKLLELAGVDEIPLETVEEDGQEGPTLALAAESDSGE